MIGHHSWRGFREGLRVPREVRYLPIAELMEENPGLHLWVRHGWLIDPKLTAITPHLTEQFDGLVAIGARRFGGHPSPSLTEMALRSSPTRRKLYEEGKYVPREYGLVIKRSDLLRWAARWRREQTAAG